MDNVRMNLSGQVPISEIARGICARSPQILDAMSFLRRIGIGAIPDARVIDVGNHYSLRIGLAAKLLGANYLGFDISTKKWRRPRSVPTGYVGSIGQIDGEFSSGEKSKSKTIRSHSQDFVLILSGGLSDPRPESKADELLIEALRVIKSGGIICVGSFFLAWDTGEMEKAEYVISKVLQLPENRNIRLEKLTDYPPLNPELLEGGHRYRVHFSE